MTVVGNKDYDSGPNAGHAMRAILSVAMTHQQMHNQIPRQWNAGTVPGNPCDDGLEKSVTVYTGAVSFVLVPRRLAL